MIRFKAHFDREKLCADSGPDLFEGSWNLSCQRADKDWGLTDCTILDCTIDAVM